MSSAEPPTVPVLCSDLIRHELTAKNAAIASYVDILWKIRSGFVVALGALVALGLKDGDTHVTLLKLGADKYYGVVVLAALGGALDAVYVRREQKVIRAYHSLIDYAVRYAPDSNDQDDATPRPGVERPYAVDRAVACGHVGRVVLRDLLRVSGETFTGRAATVQAFVPELLYIIPLTVSLIALWRGAG
jgi:hypothetical protein